MMYSLGEKVALLKHLAGIVSDCTLITSATHWEHKSYWVSRIYFTTFTLKLNGFSVPKSLWQNSWGETQPECRDPWVEPPTEGDSESSYSCRAEKHEGLASVLGFHTVKLLNTELWNISHSQLQQFCPQLVLFTPVLSTHHLVYALILCLTVQVLPGLVDERSDKVCQLGAAATKREDVILLLLLGVR